MKNNKAIILALVIISLLGCKKNNPIPEPEKKKNFIELSQSTLYLDYQKQKDTIRILDGYGEYKTYPDIMDIVVRVDNKNYRYPNNANGIDIKAEVQGDSIIIVDRFCKKDTAIMAVYYVLDKERKSASFVILPTGFRGTYIPPLGGLD